MADRSGSGAVPADARGVSQVVAVVLLVGITTVLAGFAGVYFTGIGEEVGEPAPRFAPAVAYDDAFEGDGQSLALTHESGERVPTANAAVTVTGASVYDESSGTVTDAAVYEGDVLAAQAGENLSVSETVELNRSAFVAESDGSALGADEYVDLSDAVVRVVWVGDGEASTVLFEWRAGSGQG